MTRSSARPVSSNAPRPQAITRRLLVADEERRVGGRVVVVEQLEEEAEAALRAACGRLAETRVAIRGSGARAAARADEVGGPSAPARRVGVARSALRRRQSDAVDPEARDQRRLACARRLEAQVLVGARRRGAPARRALDQPALQQVGLVDVLDRVGLLADADRERREADGPAARTPCRARRGCRGRAGRARARRPPAARARRPRPAR